LARKSVQFLGILFPFGTRVATLLLWWNGCWKVRINNPFHL